MSQTSEAFKNRVDTAVRRFVIAALGWPAEDATDRYAARTGEMIAWLRETDPTLADQIEKSRYTVLEPYYADQLNKLFRGEHT